LRVKLVIYKDGSETCTHRPSLPFLLMRYVVTKWLYRKVRLDWVLIRSFLLVEQVECTVESIINRTLHLFKDHPEDGPTIGPKHVAGIII